MGIDYSRSAIPKGEPRKRTKARKRKARASHIALVRAAVFDRDRHRCRCCLKRRADSMHELRPRSLCGKVTPRNSVAVCGNGIAGCHGFLQRHEITATLHEGRRGANGLVTFNVLTIRASEWIGTERAWILPA